QNLKEGGKLVSFVIPEMIEKAKETDLFTYLLFHDGVWVGLKYKLNFKNLECANVRDFACFIAIHLGFCLL
ncbi:MAG: hypothetical protein RR436_06260, partial [Clostridia bacterium]